MSLEEKPKFKTNSLRKRSSSENGPSAYLEPFLDKKYILASCDGKIDAFMRTLGIGALRRAMFRSAKQTMELTENNGVYSLTVTYAFRQSTTQFRIGEEFDDETPDKRKVRTVFFQDKTKLTEVRRGEKTSIVVWEFRPDKALVTAQVDDIVAKRVYKPFSRGW